MKRATQTTLLVLLSMSISCVRTISTRRDSALEEQLERVPIVKIFVKKVRDGEVQKYALMTGFPYKEGILGVHHNNNFAEIQVNGEPVKVLARSHRDDFYDDWLFLERPSSYTVDPIPDGGAVKAGTKVWVVGFPGDGIRSLPDTRQRQVMRGRVFDCTNCPENAILVVQDSPERPVANMYGFSGSPVLYFDDAGHPRVYGICVGWKVASGTLSIFGIPYSYADKIVLAARRIPSATELLEADVEPWKGE